MSLIRDVSAVEKKLLEVSQKYASAKHLIPAFFSVTFLVHITGGEQAAWLVQPLTLPQKDQMKQVVWTSVHVWERERFPSSDWTNGALNSSVLIAGEQVPAEKRHLCILSFHSRDFLHPATNYSDADSDAVAPWRWLKVESLNPERHGWLFLVVVEVGESVSLCSTFIRVSLWYSSAWPCYNLISPPLEMR